MTWSDVSAGSETWTRTDEIPAIAGIAIAGLSKAGEGSYGTPSETTETWVDA